jgi:hypothetical protein
MLRIPAAFIVLGLPFQILSAQAVPAAQRYAYLIDIGGEVVKVDLESARPVFVGKVSDSARGVRSDDGRDDQPGIEGAAVDESGPTLSLVLPDSALGDERRARRFRVVTFTLPDLRPIARYDLLVPSEEPPSLLADRFHHRLLLQWSRVRSASPMVLEYQVSSLNVTDLHETQRWTASWDESTDRPLPSFNHSSSQTLNPSLSVEPDGSLLHADGNISLVGDSLSTWRELRPAAPERDGQLRAILQVAPKELYFDGFVSEVRGGTVLWISLSDTGPRIQRLETGPSGSGKVQAAWTAPWGRASLLSAGKTVLLQEMDGPKRGGTSQMTRTERLVFYDAASGREISRLAVPELRGSYELVFPLCSTTDERYLLFRTSEGRLYVIEPALPRARKVEMKNWFSISVGCFPSAK